MRRVVACVAMLVVAATATACGGASALGTAGSKVEPIEASALPAEIHGLTVTAEDVSANLATTKDTYLDASGLFSLRSGEVAQATLQVMRFNDEARLDDPAFRRSLVTRVGGATPQTLTLGDDQVFFSNGVKQRLAVWYRDKHMFVLSTRDDFDRPRGLLRSVLEITPEDTSS